MKGFLDSLKPVLPGVIANGFLKKVL